MSQRYARSQFVDPNLGDSLEDLTKERDFYENSDDDEDGTARRRGGRWLGGRLGGAAGHGEGDQGGRESALRRGPLGKQSTR